MAKRRMRSVSVQLGMTAVVAASLAACGSDYSGYCVDQQTQQRVDDDYCDNDGGYYGGHYHWYYVHSGGYAPGIGSRIRPGSGTFSKPSGGSVSTGGISSSGGTVSRGGWGGGSSSS